MNFLFQFLSTPAGQAVVTKGGEDILTLIIDLVKAFHSQTVAPAPKAPAPNP